jgi:biotin operon repressor
VSSNVETLIELTNGERRIYNRLHGREFSSVGLAKSLGLTSGHINRAIRDMKKKGVPIKRTGSRDSLITIPEDAPTTPFNGTILDVLRGVTGYEGKSETRLLLGELGLGTRFSDRKIFEGLNAWLQINGYASKNIDTVIISGGIFPELPPFYSVGNAERMRLLGSDPDKEEVPSSPRVEQFLDEIMGDKEAADFREYKQKWLTGKINHWGDAVENSSSALETLLDGIDVGSIHYGFGDEDKFNMQYSEEMEVNRLAKAAKDYVEGKKEELNEMKNSIKSYQKKITDEQKQHDFLAEEFAIFKNLNSRVRSHMRGSSVNISSYIKETVDAEADTLFANLNGVQTRDLKRRLKLVKGKTSIRGFEKLYNASENSLKTSDQDLKKSRTELEKADKAMHPISDEIDSLERQLEQGDAITIFTKRASVTPTEAEWIYKRVKDKYIQDVESVFPARLRKKLTTHVSRTVRIGNIKYGTKKEEVAKEVEVDMEMIGGDIMVIHNTRFSGNSASKNGLSDAQNEVLYRKSLERVSNEEGLVPKTVIVAHGASGFGSKRFNTASEFKALDDSYRNDPEISTLMTLPVMHNLDRLRKFAEKGMNKTWGTKRFSKGLAAAGPVIQTMLEDGSELDFVIDNSSLIRIADQKAKRDGYRANTKKFKKEDGILREMCAMDATSRALVTDTHIGAPNFRGSPNNYLRLDRVINYLAANYGESLDELILGGDMVDGVLSHTNTDRKFYGGSLPELKSNVLDYLQDNDLLSKDSSKEDVVTAIGHIVDLFSDAAAGNPVANLDRQYDAFKPFMKRMVEEISPKSVSCMSGNHGRSTEGADEGTRLADMVRMYDKGGKIKTLVADGIGTKFGSQGGITEKGTGKKIGYIHEPAGGKNAIVATVAHLVASGYQYDETFHGHIHDEHIGFVNGTAVTIGAPCEGNTDYAEKLPVKSAIYGTTVKFSNAALKDHAGNDMVWHLWHRVHDDTLEREEYRHDKVGGLLEAAKKSS